MTAATTDTVNVPREPTEEMLRAGANPKYPCDAIDVWKAMLAAAPKAEPVDAEMYLQEAISSSPQPLRDLGEFLSSVLDEDHWKTADRLLLAIATSQPSAPASSEMLEDLIEITRLAWHDGQGFVAWERAVFKARILSALAKHKGPQS